ncbi:class I lanthipeptide [Chitinophaga nivalis]|uniref:Class I lanthipeptide n=1 Tax=Chitinophaga nivalis TaxID=2991709 RepID=A0ABT3INJ0_9BACT|nr:class I lanthipeptide [Chitinophaga nivalis]MCW3464755.1 class I lanthipeptide [Chitinophaga nivalis]MCW3485554.1 class I lanthipeptide [Chitinophaga nivalis]
MKKKNNTHKKLSLKKGIITRLTPNDMTNVYGGNPSGGTYTVPTSPPKTFEETGSGRVASPVILREY